MWFAFGLGVMQLQSNFGTISDIEITDAGQI